jgi:hypothetical protein
VQAQVQVQVQARVRVRVRVRVQMRSTTRLRKPQPTRSAGRSRGGARDAGGSSMELQKIGRWTARSLFCELVTFLVDLVVIVSLKEESNWPDWRCKTRRQKCVAQFDSLARWSLGGSGHRQGAPTDDDGRPLRPANSPLQPVRRLAARMEGTMSRLLPLFMRSSAHDVALYQSRDNSSTIERTC